MNNIMTNWEERIKELPVEEITFEDLGIETQKGFIDFIRSEIDQTLRTQLEEMEGLIKEMEGWKNCIQHNSTRVDCMECQKRIVCNHLLSDLTEKIKNHSNIKI